MINFIKFLTVVLLSLTPFSAASATPVLGKLAPDFNAITTGGVEITLSSLIGKSVVLEWTNHECPYVKKHYSTGNMQRIQRELTEKGAVWISIISSAQGLQGYVNAEQADSLSAQRGTYNTYTILDPDGAIGQLYRAKTTPHIFLIGQDGILAYMGAIDDNPSVRREAVEGAENYLLSAWADIAAGSAVKSTASPSSVAEVPVAGGAPVSVAASPPIAWPMPSQATQTNATATQGAHRIATRQ